ncbi:MAG: hypothetical protein ACKOT0_08405 [bacterium]
MEPASKPSPGKTRGRGLVIAGGILTVLSVAVCVAAAVNWVVFLATDEQGIAFFWILVYWFILAAPTWYVGVPLLAIGRSQQRGPVKLSVLAWVIAMALLLFVLVATGIGNWQFVVFPVSFLPSVAAAAWLVWGKPVSG